MTGFPAILFISSDGGLIKYHSGYAPPEEFAPIMKEALKQETDFQETFAKFQKMPDDLTINREIVKLYLQRQQIEKALPIWDKMPDDVVINRDFGIYYLGNNEIEKALLIKEKMPDDIKLNFQFVVTYLKQRNLEEASTLSQHILELDPKNTSGVIPDLHFQLALGHAQLIQNSTEELAAEYTKIAVKNFQVVIDTYPDSTKFEISQLYLGVTYSIAKMYSESIEVLEMLLNHTTDDQMRELTETNLNSVKDLAAEAAEGKTN